MALAADHRLAGRRELRRADLAGEPMPRWEPHDDTVVAYWAGWSQDSAGPDRAAGTVGTAGATESGAGDSGRSGHSGRNGDHRAKASGAASTTAATSAASAEGPRVTDINQLLDAVALGQTIAFLPRSAAHQYNRADLVFRPVVDLNPSTLAAAWPDTSRSRAVAGFVRAAVEVARDFSEQAAALA